MTNDDLQDLINCIKIEVKQDLASKVTKYKLPQEAQNDRVIEALENHFEHYKSAKVVDGVLILKHPDIEN